jgi:predicted acetyltransferase
MERDDIDLQHLRAYNEAMSQGFEMYFRKYHQRQLHLWMLMTHPQFRRRGAGTMLCNWGLKESAKRGDWPLTLMASPMGKGLYEHLGYKLLGNGVAQISGEEAKVDIYAMEKLIS